MNRTGFLSLLAVTAAFSVMGCSKDPQPAQNPQQLNNGGQFQQQPGGFQQQPGGFQQQPQQGGFQQQPQQGGFQPGPQPGGQTQQPQQQPQQFPFPQQQQSGGGASGTAQVIDPNLAALATGPLRIFANSEAPGMAAEGPTVAGNFQQGQTLESQFTFQPGKCYTVVAQGAGITEIDIEMQYVSPIPGINPAIGRDNQKGAQASIGGRGNCLRPISPIAAPAKFIVHATQGAGLGAAQLFVK